MKKINQKRAINALSYTGLLGHKYIGLDNKYRCCVEANSASSALLSTPKDGSAWRIDIKNGKRKYVMLYP